MRVLVFLVALFSACVNAQAEDLLGSDQQVYGKEIRVFSATQNGDRYATVTGRVLMNGTLAAPAKLFSDVDGLPGWIDNLAAVKEISVRAPIDRTIYMRYSAPTGFDDRDGLMRFFASKEAPGVIILTFEDIPAFPLRPDAVRMTDVRGRFRVEQMSQGTLAVEFRLHYDASARPVTLANLSVRQQVKQTLVRMRQHIEGPLRSASFDGALARSLSLE
ncbi:hypothetical protein [Limnohabitans sp.]|uniref:hypothetical protein n=1 Tax=Limnohabitans sp. TaxID=1907725 RepID=UPI0025BF594F|nr:hypothetical protein [Limnohabitans sp.]